MKVNVRYNLNKVLNVEIKVTKDLPKVFIIKDLLTNPTKQHSVPSLLSLHYTDYLFIFIIEIQWWKETKYSKLSLPKYST